MKITNALALLLPTLLPAMAHAQNYTYSGKYSPCVDYYTVGSSPCQPIASTPIVINMPAPQNAAQAVAAPQPPKDEVAKYLENYGKPPREFVEFYLNPSPENAMKWVATYNSMVQRSQALSRSWTQADAMYEDAVAKGLDPNTLVANKLPGVTNFNVPLSAMHTEALAQAADARAAQTAKPTATFAPQPSEVRLGAFADNTGAADAAGKVHLTYYFSDTCPYCAKMTPELASIFNNMNGKLTLTCVDVTPLSATHRPSPDNIAGKLPCNWRTPNEDEVETANIQQTPTMLISRGSGKPLRLSGYVPMATMMGYLTGAPSPAAASTTPNL